MYKVLSLRVLDCAARNIKISDMMIRRMAERLKDAATAASHLQPERVFSSEMGDLRSSKSDTGCIAMSCLVSGRPLIWLTQIRPCQMYKSNLVDTFLKIYLVSRNLECSSSFLPTAGTCEQL